MPQRLIVFIALLTGFIGPALVHAAASSSSQPKDAAQFAWQYVQSLAQSNVEHWAAADLGCLSRSNGLRLASRARLGYDDLECEHLIERPGFP